MSFKSVIANLECDIDDALLPALRDMYLKNNGWIRIELNEYGEPRAKYIPYDEVYYQPLPKKVESDDEMPF